MITGPLLRSENLPVALAYREVEPAIRPDRTGSEEDTIELPVVHGWEGMGLAEGSEWDAFPEAEWGEVPEVE